MHQKSKDSKKSSCPVGVKIYGLLAFTLWSGLVGFLAWQESRIGYQFVYQLAEAEARGSYNKDLVYRRWAAKQGGLYVRNSEYTPPNPYLSHIPDRDMSLPSGVDLTLVNPAYMTRQVHELANEQFGAKGHITSLNPLRPQNTPDAWERHALELFDQGQAEFSEPSLIDGVPYLRMMLPMITEDFCLKCHANQGYQVGDIRGGISVSIPLNPYLQAYQSSNRSMLVNKFIVWLVGSILIFTSCRVIRGRLLREYRARLLLESSEEKYRKLFNDATAGFALANAETGEILECNDALAEMVERSVDELIGQPQSILHPERPVKDGMTKGFLRHQDTYTNAPSPARLITKTGHVFDVEIKDYRFERDGLRLIFGIFNDVSERVKAERILRENEEKYRALLNNQNDAIYLHRVVADSFSIFSEVNVAAVERFGYSREELLQMSIEDLVVPEILEQQQKSGHFKEILDRGSCTYESILMTQKGDRFPVEITTTVIELQGEMYFLSIARDMTERKVAEEKRKELESQLRQKYKMEAVGTMAGGIAHDFNNILAVIMTNLELMGRKAGESNPLLPRIEQAKAASARAGDLVKQILTYSRQGEQNLKPIKLAENVEETLKLLRSTIPASIEILKNIDETAKDVWVDADPIQIEEVLVNLCTNAVHAMGEKGLLSVNMSLETLEKGELPLQPESLQGICFRLDVVDTGSGMTPELIEKIFDPFYTTKPEGQGTGMGLSISHGIVRRHNGCLVVDSLPGEGSAFSIYLPVSEKQNENDVEAVAEEVSGGPEHLLFVDDEESLVSSVSDFFLDYGYSVTCETDSLKAVELFKKQPQQFDLIITDQTMPGKTGLELMQDVLEVRPEIPIILCTGYSASVSREKAIALGAREFMLKPVSLPVLARAVRSALSLNP